MFRILTTQQWVLFKNYPFVNFTFLNTHSRVVKKRIIYMISSLLKHMSKLNGSYRELTLDYGLHVMLQNTSTKTISGRLRVTYDA